MEWRKNYEKHPKKHLISTDHFQNLLMGMRKKYAGMMVHQCEEIKYSINDISKVHFDEQVIDLKDYLKDFSLKIES